MDATILERPGGTWYDGTEGEEPTKRPWLLWGAIAGVAAMGLSYGAGFVGGHAPVAGLQRENAALSRQVQAAQRTEQALLTHRSCSTEDGQITEIQRLVNSGRPQIAAGLVSVDLQDTQHPACPQTRVALGALGYAATMDALFSQGSVSPLDHHPLLTWLGAEREADRLGVPPSARVSPLSVAVQAYNDHLWELSRAAFLRAWKQGLVEPSEVEQVASYYATLRNFGRALVQLGSGQERTQGYVLLRTADVISEEYSLGRGEAHADLIGLLGQKTSQWPAADGHDPVLVAGRHG